MILLQINKKVFYYSKILTILFAIFLSASCATVNLNNVSSDQKNFENWEILTSGFLIKHYYLNKKTQVTCVKVDLDTPSIQLELYPSSISTNLNAFHLKDFAKKHNTIVAINTTPFKNKDNHYELVGILKDKEKIVSPANEKYSALAFNYSNGKLRAKILKNQKSNEVYNFDFVIGGFFTILENNNIIDYANIKNNRTAVGISQDGRFLYLLNVIGTFPVSKNGMTYSECAQLLKSFGAFSAIQFDGGSSSDLAINETFQIKKQIKKSFFTVKIPAAMGFKIYHNF